VNRANIAILVIAVAVLLAIGNAQTNRTESVPGRYQLLAGETDFVGKTTMSVEKGVFRIDTVTGATSIYTAGFDRDGKTYSEWLPIK
jgi:hypothetical protein